VTNIADQDHHKNARSANELRLINPIANDDRRRKEDATGSMTHEIDLANAEREEQIQCEEPPL
jgi:hypothetical protein